MNEINEELKEFLRLQDRTVRNRRKNKRVKLWNKIDYLYENTNTHKYSWFEFISNCGCFANIGIAPGQALPENYIIARKLVNQDLTAHDIVELHLWFNDDEVD